MEKTKGAKMAKLKMAEPKVARAHSTGDGRGEWDTKRIAVCALFVSLSIVTSFIEIPIFPAAPFLKYDPSGIFCLLAALMFGPATGAVVVSLPWVFRIFTNPAGAVMSLFMGLCGCLVCGFVYKKKPNQAGLIIALISAIIASTLASIIANLIVTPLYTGVSIDVVAGMLLPIILPFNLLKFSINSIVAGLVFSAIRSRVDF